MIYALRALARSPGFTVVAVLTLALGIGANTALFSVADPVLTRRLPVERPDELVLLRTVGSPAWSDAQALVPYALFDRIRAGNSSFADAFVFEYQRTFRRMRVRNDRAASLGTLISSMPVSGTYFRALGISPALGRMFTEADDRAGAPPLAVISYRFWQQRYGGSSDVIGQRVSLGSGGDSTLLSDMTATIVGVAPRGFHGVDLDVASDMWLPITPFREAMFKSFYPRGTNIGILRLMARLRAGVSVEQAQAEIDGITASVFQALPARSIYGRVAASKPRIRVEPAASGYSSLREQFKHPLQILSAAVAFVLLLACANVASLMLARAVSQHKDIAIRLAIGSGRLAIVRLVLAESLILAAAGGTLALLVFRWVRSAVAAYLPAESGLAAMITLDSRLFAFTAAVSLVSVLLFSLAPALWMWRADLNQLLKEPHGYSHRSKSAVRLHKGLIPVQVGFSLVLLIGAGLFLQTLQNLRAVETGFDRSRVLQLSVDARSDSVRHTTSRLPAALVERLEAIPGVESLTFYGRGGLLQEQDRPETVRASYDSQSREALDVASMLVGRGFFSTTGIAVVAGRGFDRETSSTRTVILSASLARHLFGDEENAVGRFVQVPSASGSAYELQVIGVAEDAPHVSLRDPHVWTIYSSTSSAVPSTMSIIALRTKGDAGQLVAAVRAAVGEFGGNFEVTGVQTFHEITEASIASERLVAQLSGVFGALALFLASIGIYGLIAYTVTQRTAEMGLRMALGARVEDVIRLVVGGVMVLVVAGLGLGLLGAGLAARFISGLLFGVSSYDPATVGIALLILLAAAGAAAYVPASRAARRVDPMIALRGE